ncbi:MAG: GTP-binding protein [Verrucomicrobiae bacterium]|nr:GTP-binding protein [Verrucomicrobiae bacterium]
MIPLALVTGFLGSGKTTLLKQLARRHRDRRIVYLVNEFSARDVDAALLEREAERVVSIAGGSIFCRCRTTEFIEHLRTLPSRFGGLDAVVVEASGIADPSSAGTLLRETRLDGVYRLSDVVVVVDPGTFPKLLRTLSSVRAQVQAASRALINKTDLHPPALVEQVEAAIRGLNPGVAITRTIHCAVEMDLFAADGAVVPQGRRAVDTSPRFICFNVPVPHELDLERLREAVSTVQDGIHRIKGFARSAGRCVRVDYSASGWQLEEAAGDVPPTLVFIMRGPCPDDARRLVHDVRSGCFGLDPRAGRAAAQIGDGLEAR